LSLDKNLRQPVTMSPSWWYDIPADLSRIRVRANLRNFIIDLLHFFQLLDLETAMTWGNEMKMYQMKHSQRKLLRVFPMGHLGILISTFPRSKPGSASMTTCRRLRGRIYQPDRCPNTTFSGYHRYHITTARMRNGAMTGPQSGRITSWVPRRATWM
jgi:hypothetical protein